MTSKTWYMNISVSDRKAFDGFWEQGHTIWGYERGLAKMKVVPKAEDRVLVLSRKHIIYTGTLITNLVTTKYPERGGMYLIAFQKQTPPIFIDKCFRRNYTLCKDEIVE
jgi:hypothetical protein